MKPVSIELDITETLSPAERKQFELRTGLVKAPVTIILPPGTNGCLKEALRESEIVVVFLHGLGGGRWSWGVSRGANDPEGLAAQVLHPLWRQGRKAVGLAMAGIGQDGSELGPTSKRGITPQNYANQLEETLRSLHFLEGKKIIAIGHSIGAAAAWEFGCSLAENISPLPDLTVVALSPVRTLTESRFLTLGCRLSGAALGVGRILSTLFHPLTEPATRKIAILAAGLRGLAHQGKFAGNLGEVKGVVVVGERDWVARRGLKEVLTRARSIWPVSVLPGVGHNLLTIPTLGMILVTHISKFLQG
ncbi:MAG: alpha/beta fold hydrolase [Anaerolineae bacterium]